MGKTTKIEWTRSDDGTPGATWNPTTGCSRVSPGCEKCYAIHDAHRLGQNPNEKVKAAYHGLTRHKIGLGRQDWTGEVRCLPERLTIPLHWKKPKRIFVNSQSDLFHEKIPDEFIDRVFAVMALAPQHVFQVLTKRPERMRAYCSAFDWNQIDSIEAVRWHMKGGDPEKTLIGEWPLPNCWLGTSVENQATADGRIPLLLKTPAAVRFLSIEPMLAPIDLSGWLYLCPRCDGKGCSEGDCQDGYVNQGIGWVIVGGESGPDARPLNEDWVRDIRDQCQEAGVAFFYKQKIEQGKKVSLPFLDGKQYAEYPSAHTIKTTL